LFRQRRTSKAAAGLKGKPLIIIAAGVKLATLEKLFGEIAIARTKPDTPALLVLDATALHASAHATHAQRTKAVKIIEAFGICESVDCEDLLDAVTAVSGNEPAYFFLMKEEMIKAGVKLGLTTNEASRMMLQAALGAASMASNGDVAPDELRRKVTALKGTTHAAITSMQDSGFGSVIEKAMFACRDRAVEIGAQ
jgi:pyrroline-5-carboxylate reductase